MNKQRRKYLYEVLDRLAKLKEPIEKSEALAIVNRVKDDVEICSDEEQCALDNRPEPLQWSTVNNDMEDNISDLNDVSGDLDVAEELIEGMSDYSYDPIKNEIVTIVNTIKQVINR